MTIESTRLIAEIDAIMQEAESLAAAERLAGNIVKESFWRGRLTAAHHLRAWVMFELERRCREVIEEIGGQKS